jgi:hypothetical protein
MNLRVTAACILALSNAWAHAATDYERIQVDDVLEGAIGMGFMSRDLPLPPGRWQVLQAKTETLALTPRSPSAENLRPSLPMYAFTLRNTDPQSLVAAMVLRFSPRASNVDWLNVPCAAADPVQEMVDTLGIASPQAALFGCVRASSVAGMQRTITQASPTSGARWVYDYLRALTPYAAQLPDQAVLVTAHANQYRGRNFSYLFLVRQQAPWLSPGYTQHLRQWMNTTGQALLDIARNNKTALSLPTAYTPDSSDAGLAAAAPVAPPSLPSRVPLDKIRISDYFDREPLSADTVGLALRRCIAQMPANLPALHDGSLFNTAAQTISFFAPPQSNYFLVKPGEFSTCVQSSAAGYPILAGAAIRGVMQIQGVPESVARRWYRRLALNLALHGDTTVAFTRPDGSATIARLVLMTGSPLALRHVHYERAAGSWEDLELEDQFSDPAYSSLRTSTSAGRGEAVTQVKL